MRLAQKATGLGLERTGREPVRPQKECHLLPFSRENPRVRVMAPIGSLTHSGQSPEKISTAGPVM